MKIATYNVNVVNGRLPGLIRWLAETKPDVAPPGTESTLGEVSRSRYPREVMAI